MLLCLPGTLPTDICVAAPSFPQVLLKCHFSGSNLTSYNSPHLIPFTPSSLPALLKNPPAMQETRSLIPRWGRPLEKEWLPTPLCLRIPRTEEPGRLQSTGSKESDKTVTNTQRIFIIYLLHVFFIYFSICLTLLNCSVSLVLLSVLFITIPLASKTYMIHSSNSIFIE